MILLSFFPFLPLSCAKVDRTMGEEGRSIVEEKTWPTRDGSHVLHVSFPSIVIFHFYKNPFDDVHVNRQISRSKKFFCSKFLAKFLINAINPCQGI